MGAYAPAPLITPALLRVIKEQVLQRAVDGLRKEGRPFVGVLYAGLMIIKPKLPNSQPSLKVLEFNCRFGDPETQVCLLGDTHASSFMY